MRRSAYVLVVDRRTVAGQCFLSTALIRHASSEAAVVSLIVLRHSVPQDQAHMLTAS
jgi:hypothetical protein